MKTTSGITGTTYEPDECVFIPNMLQNFKYLSYGAELLDIIPDNRFDQNKILFVWNREDTKHLYDAWCKHELI